MSSLPPPKPHVPHQIGDDAADGRPDIPTTPTTMPPLDAAAALGDSDIPPSAAVDGAAGWPGGAAVPPVPEPEPEPHSLPDRVSLLRIGVLDLLEADPRPSFVVSLLASSDVLYSNPALTSDPLLPGLDTPRLCAVAPADIVPARRGALPAVQHAGILWTRFILGGQFIVVSANVPMPVPEVPVPLPSPQEKQPAAEIEPTASDSDTQTGASLATVMEAGDSPQRPEHAKSATADSSSPTPTGIPLADSSAGSGGGGGHGNGNSDAEQGDEQYWYHLKTIANLVPVGLAVLDPDGSVLFANRAWYRIMGIPQTPGRESIDREHLFRHIEEEDQAVVIRSYEQVFSVPSISFGFRVKKSVDENGEDEAPGESKHVLATATSDRDAEGRLVRTVVCLRDIIEEQRSIAAAADLYAQQASNLRRMTEYATVGLYDMDTDGRLRSANRVFVEMCGLDIAEGMKLSAVVVKPWLRCVIDEDQPVVMSALNRLAVDGEYKSVEVRLNKPWTSDDGDGNRIDAPHWIDVTMLPIKDAEGKVYSVTGCLCDVSLRKWQLERERQVKEEAIESRRQLENFVDVTSHEIRNPLTVIMHCGDAVLESLQRIHDLGARLGEAPTTESDLALQKALVEDAVDYTEIIVGSALHQKAIVDDILTMSKLDSDLLTVTAVTADPIEVVRSSLKMVEVQARQEGISLIMAVGPSFEALGVRYLDLDPSRLKQILINLLTNALKFTRSGDVREVKVTIGASRTRPTDETCSVSFMPRTELRTAEKAATPDDAAADEARVFIIFEVQDTGEGLTKEGQDSLFQKFVQVESATHIKHGGSGLGLFISKRLAEIQKGAIGVASQPGVGSTFVFYIEARISPHGVVPEVLSPAEAAKKAIAAGLGSPRQKSTDVPGQPAAGTKEQPPSRVPDVASGTAKPAPASDAGGIEATSGSTEAEAAEADVGSGQLATVPATPPEVRGVLLVEDNMLNQKVTRRYFEKGGFPVQVAGNGLEAMEKIRQSDRCVPGSFPISVVLMDMEMPVQGGLECTQNIRALETAGVFSGGRIPVVMITGNARPEQIAEARAAGCDDVVVKPFQMNLLHEHIQVVIRMLWEEDRRLLADRETAQQPEEGLPAEAA